MATIRTRPEGSHRRALRTGPGRSWVATTISGVALLVLLGVHMVANHFVVRSVGGLRSYRQVLEYMRRKTSDYDRWLGGMRRLQARVRGQ